MHKFFLLTVKLIPFIFAVYYFLFAIASCSNIHLIILPNVFYLSPISALFILCASFTFKFCIWHRLPIYYSLVLQIINTIDYYSPVVFSDNVMLYVYLLITIMFILLGMYFKNKLNGKRKKNNITRF